jgi:PIN domain nuclease of toxin-antitoxin system
VSRLLLDTHALLWAVADASDLGRAARAAIEAADAPIRLSVVSLWEIVVKTSLGKLKLDMPIAQYVDERVAALGAEILAIETAHLAELEILPHHHRDPFDRLIAAQCKSEGLVLLSCDAAFDAYGVTRIWD